MAVTTWFTSDFHLGHANIISHSARPFANVDEMNEALVANHNAVVRDGDTVIHLGDFWWGHPRELATWRDRLNGKQVLVPGNHDGCHSCHSKHRRELTRYTVAGFDVLDEQCAHVLPRGTVVMLCHFPLRKNAGDDARYPEHRPTELLPGCKWLVCGHVHEKWCRVGRCINVGVDQWGFRPVSEEELETFIGWLRDD
jgi:calcineurin-like phosphoesterase family protein